MPNDAMLLGQVNFGPCSILCAACEPRRACQHALERTNRVRLPAAAITALHTGWQCPLCRVVHAPSVTRCDCAASRDRG